ncbi:MAG: M20/M25/M40 family metallo-hydrolase [Acidobacteriota bacterium]
MSRKELSKLILAAAVVAGLFIPAVPAQTRGKNSGGSAASTASAKFGNADAISAKTLRDHLTFIASDELEGRDTPSRGLDIAAKYIAAHLATWGITPAGGEGTYFQKLPLRRTVLDATSTRLEIAGQSFKYGEDFLVTAAPAAFAGAPMVFAGNGWEIKAKNIDPYKGLDVRGKVIVVASGLPAGVGFADLQGKSGVDYSSPQTYARDHGAKAVIVLSNFSTLSNWQGTRWTQSEKGGVEFGPVQATAVPSISVSPRVMTAIFQGESMSGSNVFSRMIKGESFESFDLKPEKRAGATVSVKREDTSTQNVVGILEGSDPVLKNEYVAIGAHYDHVGTNPFAAGPDKIWNGADDDGSGTVAVLTIAEAMAKGPRPKRSILFIWHAGEEKGLWGSEYFADNPTVPIESIITELNIDMIGRYQNPGDENDPRNKNLPKPGEVFLIGSKLMSTDLGDISEATNKAYLNLSFNYKYDDPKDPEQYFYRSDHYNYAKKGVPIIFYMDGDHKDYHQPSDSIEKINFEQMEKVTRTIAATGWELANRAMRPRVDKPLAATAGN